MATIKKINRVLIANRGEIACRLIQACQELSIKTVAVYSDVDADLRHVHLADIACPLDGESAKDTYLNLAKLIAIAKEQNCDAVHPGYGFLSERAEAAEAFNSQGVRWIGPTPENIRLLGDKLGAKKVLDKSKVPTLPWGEVDPANEKQLLELAQKIGFPVLLKAAGGGGGKGMRLVTKDSELSEAAQAASREALASFGNAALLMEKFLVGPRHIEVQIIGDRYGQVIHLGERECSAQRKHQKVLEEAPAVVLSEETRSQICESARSLGASVGYQNAGTVEFLVDEKENFYFLEVNSRLQVEHPVTELVWGIDLVQAQIKVTQGMPLTDIFPLALAARGHAIEARIYAEDAAKGFSPSPGELIHVQWPTGAGIRIETGFKTNDQVTLNYDAMLAKVIASGADREQARQRLLWALRNTQLFGVTTNINYLQDILEHPQSIAGKIDVKFLERAFKDWKDPIPEDLINEKANLIESSGLVSSFSNISKRPTPWDGIQK